MKNRQLQQKETASKNMLSSFQPKSHTIIDREELKKCKIIIKSLGQHNEAYDFKTPVDWKGMNLTDYPTIVKHPMDLGTVEKQLNANKYRSVEQFIDDVQLIWDNCKTYNQAGSWIYESAQKIERIFKKMIKNYFQEIAINIPQKQNQSHRDKHQNLYENISDEDITYFEKLNFCERVKGLTSEQLQKLIDFLSKSHPETLKEVGITGNEQTDSKDRIQINVDNFTANTFREVNEVLTKMLVQRGEQIVGTKKVKLS